MTDDLDPARFGGPALPGGEASRPATRVAIRFALETIARISRGVDQNLPRTVTFVALGWENARPCTLEPPADTEAQSRLQLAQRTSVSVYRLSRRLRVPYETCRRSLKHLEQAGLCVRTAEGYLVPPMTPSEETVETLSKAAWRSVQTFIADLRRAGVTMPADGPPASPDLQLRAARFSAAYFLDCLDALVEGLDVDILRAFLFLAVNYENFAPHLDRRAQTGSAGPSGILTDDERTPTSVSTIARTFDVPYETARRNIGSLVEARLCARTPDGRIYIPASVIQSPALTRTAALAAMALNTFIGRLGAIGFKFPD